MAVVPVMSLVLSGTHNTKYSDVQAADPGDFPNTFLQCIPPRHPGPFHHHLHLLKCIYFSPFPNYQPDLNCKHFPCLTTTSERSVLASLPSVVTGPDCVILWAHLPSPTPNFCSDFQLHSQYSPLAWPIHHPTL